MDFSTGHSTSRPAFLKLRDRLIDVSRQEIITITDRVVYVTMRGLNACPECSAFHGKQHPANKIPYPGPACRDVLCCARGTWHRVEADLEGHKYVGAPLFHAPLAITLTPPTDLPS